MRVESKIKRIGFAIVNLILTILYFVVITFLLMFSTMPDFYGTQNEYLIEESTIFPILLFLFFLTLGITQFLTFKIKPNKILDALYAEFVVLKWLTLATAIFGCFSTWWFYHSAGIGAHIAMVVWWAIFGFIYLIISRVTKRITSSIDKKKNNIKWDNLIETLKKNN